MINLTVLQNLTPLVFNSTNLTDSQNLVPNLISTTDTVSQGYFGLGVMVAVFIVLFVASFKQDGDIRMDLTRSLMISSGFSSILGIIMLTIGLSSSFVHTLWFLSIFMISIIVLFNLKKKGF